MTPIKFGTSGWRAVIAEEFTFGNARRVVTAVARVLADEGKKGGLVLVGYDTRFLKKNLRGTPRRPDEAASVPVGAN